MHYEIVPTHEVLKFLKEKSSIHHADLKDKSLYPYIDVDWGVYEEASLNGLSYTILAKNNEDIVGYSTYVITHDLNIKNIRIALNVGIFIEKPYRGRIIVEFLKECDNLLVDKTIQKILYIYSDTRMGSLLRKSGYVAESINWTKNI